MTTAIRVAYQGEPGAFSESAARRLLGEGLATLPCRSFEEMFDSVGRGDADCCVAPIENSLAGSIHRNYDLLFQSRLTINGETNLRIVHNLIARPDSELATIRRVYSHPVALAQCARFLSAHPDIESVPVHDTAGAVRIIMERGQHDEAAIASDRAAEIYGARILAEGVEDHTKNYTRFFLLSHTTMTVQETPRRWKTSLVLQLRNEPGALFRALGAFALPQIDLSKIESRPIEGRPWEYAFYLDIIGNVTDAPVARAIDNLTEMAESVKVLGSYPTRW
jgi:prephenate dehydratase